MWRRRGVFQHAPLMFYAKKCVHIPNKKLFEKNKPINSILPLWKGTADPVPIADILKREGFEITKEDVLTTFRDNMVSNTKHWAALSHETKSSMKLPDPVISALDTSPEVQLQVQLQVLQRFSIRTVEEWHNLSDADKQDVKTAGIPQAVINDLNTNVRRGLLLPEFKFAEKAAFLSDKKYAGIRDEAKSLLQYALLIDDAWVLTRTECDALCHNYQRMVELTLKAVLQGWHNGTDIKIKHFDQGTDSEGKPCKFFYWKRYKSTHDLVHLAEEVKKHTQFRNTATPAEKNLKRITECAGDTTYGSTDESQGSGIFKRISCADFADHAEPISKYIVKIWEDMEQSVLKHSTFESKRFPVATESTETVTTNSDAPRRKKK
jgi:hypothetical protein